MNQDVIANNLSSFKNHIEDFEKGYRDLVNDFESFVNHITALNGMWTGEAHDAFMNRFDQDKAEVENMLDYIKEIHAALKYADTEYSRCEREVAGFINEINV